MKTGILGAACAAAAALATGAHAQDSAQALQDAFVAAVSAEDAAALAALYIADADSYAPDGSVAKGRDAIAANWQAFFDAYDDISIALEPHGSHDIGKKNHAAWGLWAMTVTPASEESEPAEPLTMRGRYTDVSVKTDDGWRYMVDHASMLAEAAEGDDASE